MPNIGRNELFNKTDLFLLFWFLIGTNKSCLRLFEGSVATFLLLTVQSIRCTKNNTIEARNIAFAIEKNRKDCNIYYRRRNYILVVN